jgi:hypothetical protein
MTDAALVQIDNSNSGGAGAGTSISSNKSSNYKKTLRAVSAGSSI